MYEELKNQEALRKRNIFNSFCKGQLDEDISERDELEKAGKAVIGEIRKRKNGNWVKHYDGWVHLDEKGKYHIWNNDKKDAAKQHHIDFHKKTIGEDTDLGKKVTLPIKFEKINITAPPSDRAENSTEKYQREMNELANIVKSPLTSSDERFAAAQKLTQVIKEANSPTQDIVDRAGMGRVSGGFRVGDKFKINGEQQTVHSIGDNGELHYKIKNGAGVTLPHLTDEGKAIKIIVAEIRDKSKVKALENADKIDKGSGGHVKNMSLQELETLAKDMELNQKEYQDKFDDAQGIYNLTTERIEELNEEKEENKPEPKVNTFNYRSIIIRNDVGENVKGKITYNNESGKYDFTGTINGGKPYDRKGITLMEASILFDDRLNKIDPDAKSDTEIGVNKNNPYKEYRENFKNKFLVENEWKFRGTDESQREKGKEKFAILSDILRDNNAWRFANLKGVNIESITEEEVDSRFSNERPGYVGMFSGDLITIVKQTAIIGGVKYQRVGEKSYSNDKSFW